MFSHRPPRRGRRGDKYCPVVNFFFFEKEEKVLTKTPVVAKNPWWSLSRDSHTLHTNAGTRLSLHS